MTGFKTSVDGSGLRYEVTYVDEFGFTKKFGWANDMAAVNTMLESIRLNPSMKDGKYVDRQAAARVEAGHE